MKRIIAFLLTVVMLGGIGTFCSVAAAEGIVKDAYTFMDTCYSPELDVYVAVAKDMTYAHRQNNQSTPGQIFYSNDGSTWLPATVPATNRDLIHFSNPETRQCVVWWQKEGVFVAAANNKLLISRDGATWAENSAWWHATDGNLRTRSNTTIATNGNQLVTVTGSVIRTYDSVDEQFTAYQVGTGLYMQAAGVSTDEPTVYFGLAQNYYHVVTGRTDQTGVNTIGTQINETKNGAPVETVYSEQLNGWLVLNQTNTLHIVTKTAKSCVDVNNISLSEGGKNTAVLSAAAVSGDTVILGNADGKLFTAPLSMDAITSSETTWKLVAPDDDEIKISDGDEIRSITAIDDETFFFATTTKLYAALKSEDGWKYYDTTKNILTLEGENRIEIPSSGSVTENLTAKAYTWSGRQAENKIVSVEALGTLPHGVSVVNTDGEFGVTVSSETEDSCELTVKVTAENGQTKNFSVFVVDEAGVAIDGFDELLVPDAGEASAQYEYSAVVMGSDGKPMTSRTAIIDVERSSVPSGVTFEKTSNNLVTFTVTSSAVDASIVVNAVSEIHSEYKAEKVIKLAGRHVAKAKIISDIKTILIRDAENASAQFTAQLFDQVDQEMPEEKYRWSVESKDNSNLSGVSIDAESGALTVQPTAYAGTIVVKVTAVSDSRVCDTTDVILTYTDLRKVKEDIRECGVNASVPVEHDLVLPLAGKYGSTLEWKSSDTSLLQIVADPDKPKEKSIGAVKRASREDKKMVLTVTAKLNNVSITQEYELTIKKADTLCTNGDFADGTYNGWEKKSEKTTRTLIEENGKKVLQVTGEGVYQVVSLTNDSSYGFEGRVKADKGSSVRLISQTGGTIAILTADGTYQDIKGSLDYRKQKSSFEDKIYLECDSVMTIESLKVYEITLELDKVTSAVNKAVYSKKKEDVAQARTLLADFYDLPVKTELENKLDGIDTSSGGNNGGGSGGGGGSKAPSSVVGGGQSSSAPALPEKAADNYADDLDTFLLNFKDMKSHWAREDVEYMAGLNLVSGKEQGVFAPDDNISRAEFAVLVTRVMGLEAAAYENSFYDVVSEDWYSGYIQTVKSNNYMNGYDGLFRPEAAISREEIAKVIVEAYNSKTNGKLEKGGALYFNDLADISYWAYDYIVNAVNLGFVHGVSEEIFAPQSIATRAEAAVMLRRMYDKLHPAE